MKEVHNLSDLRGYTGLVLFSATWCSPCKTYKPALEAYAERRGINVLLIDAGKRPDMAGSFTVRAVPTTIFFVGGLEFRRHQGTQTDAALDQMLP